MTKLKLDWSRTFEYIESNVLKYAPKTGGVYRLIREEGDEDKPEHRVFYVGQADNIGEKLRQHLGVTEPNACLKRHLHNYTCYFRYAEIASIADRDGAERALYDKFSPTCNEVAPSAPPADINNW